LTDAVSTGGSDTGLADAYNAFPVSELKSEPHQELNMVCSESCQSEIGLKKVFSIQKRQVYRS
jgi:hypothetical protein